MMTIRIHNAALQRGLTPSEAKVYAYLIACSNRLNHAVVRVDTVCTACGIGSRTTVFTALRGLRSKGLIGQYRRRNVEGDYIANGYVITPLRGAWFELDTMSMSIFSLDKSVFLTYLFLLKCRKPKARTVYSSLRRTARALSVCKNTVIKAIRRLTALKILRKSRPVSTGRLNKYMFIVGLAMPQKNTHNITNCEVLVNSGFLSVRNFLKRLYLFVKNALKLPVFYALPWKDLFF